MAVENVLKMIKENQVKFLDLRFTDTRGKLQHMTVSADVNESFLQHGKMFDGSSIAGWKDICDSDMVLIPDLDTAVMDPFFEEPTLVLICDVHEPLTGEGYECDPRLVAKRAEQYLIDSGIADVCFVGPEAEFFILDDVRWNIAIDHVFFKIDSQEACWNCGTQYDGGNQGHRPRLKGGYFPVPPVDSSQDIRSAMCLMMEEMGLKVETHHHEVATGNQNEINTRFNTLQKKADELQIFKYVVHNVANAYGKSATFMPKPLIGDNGSGMHCHMSLFKDGTNLFTGNQYAGLSELALYFIGGVLKHARTLNAFTNPTTNSYKRLVPGFEAPVLLAYSAYNRSAAIRVPYDNNPEGRRLEIRFPDPSANGYLAFASLLMAGLDGIKNKINPGAAIDKDLYELSDAEKQRIPTSCGYLDQALENLAKHHDFLLMGNVFSKPIIEKYIQLKMDEVTRLRMITHPVEFDMYYSV